MIKSIRQLGEESPADVVEHLKMSDMEYWEAVKKEILYPFLDEKKPYGRRILDKNVDRDDVYSHVYEKMVIEHKLENLRDKSQVCSFIIEYAKAYVSSLFDRRNPEDENGGGRQKRSRKIVEVLIDSDDDTKDGGIEQIAQSGSNGSTYKIVNGVISQRHQEPLGLQSDDDLSDSTLASYQNLRTGFDTLWEQNPRRALALLLRYVKGLSSREMRSFMDLASENYVNQVVNVAKGDMRIRCLAVTEAIGKEES